MATIRTIRLDLAFQGETGRILINKEWRIWTVETEEDSADAKVKVARELQVILKAANAQGDTETVEHIQSLLTFLVDPETDFIKYKGEWDERKAKMFIAMRDMAKEIIKENPHLLEQMSPSVRKSLEQIL